MLLPFLAVLVVHQGPVTLDQLVIDRDEKKSE